MLSDIDAVENEEDEEEEEEEEEESYENMSQMVDIEITNSNLLKRKRDDLTIIDRWNAGY